MNIIRTKVVELSSIPAFAYKQKLAAGGSGIKIMRPDGSAAVCSIDRRSGDMIPYGSIDEALFPMEAFDEAFELTNGLPYSARGNVILTETEVALPEDVQEEAPADQVDMTTSIEYKAIIGRYADEKEKLNYALMNKDFIQFASRSKMVADLIGVSAKREEILLSIVKNRAAEISSQRDRLDDESVRLLIETLDEIDPRSAFKELNAHIQRMLSRGRRK